MNDNPQQPMANNSDSYGNLANSDYVWKREGKRIILKKSYSKSKRFVLRAVFLTAFLYLGFLSGMIGSGYDFPWLIKNMNIMVLILGAASFPVSGYYLRKVDVVTIDTVSKIIKQIGIAWHKTYRYRSATDFVRKRSLIGGSFQAPVETLTIKSQEGKLYQAAKIVMPDQNGFQPVIDAIRTCELDG